eukprot:500657-Rhodomonas_salina.2
MSGTDLAYGATSWADVAHGIVQVYPYTCYKMSGTDLAYTPTPALRYTLSVSAYAPRSAQSSLPQPSLRSSTWTPPRARQVNSPTSLRACYAVSGTDVAYGAPGCPMRCPVLT